MPHEQPDLGERQGPWGYGGPWEHGGQWHSGSGNPREGWENAGWPRRTPPPGARWFPVVVAAFLQLPGLLIALRFVHDPLATGVLLLAFASSFLLLLSRSYPGPMVAAIGALCVPAIAFGFGPPLAAIPLALAVVSAVVHGARAWAWGTLAGVALVGPLIAYVVVDGIVSIIRPLITVLALCLLVGVGEAVRNRRERYRELARRVAARRETAAEAERVRIARELHDVLAHSLSQISVQAGVGLHLFDSQPEKARESLSAIKTTSSQALEEVRGVLGFLRTESEQAARAPEPDIARIPVLVDTYSRAGVDVDYRNELTSTPAPAIQLAIYRIVQESLTNIGRHAQAHSVSITVAEEGHDYVVTIQDDGRGVTGAADRSGGGLLGMRERAELLGGRFEAANRADGGFRVSARIPVRTAQNGAA